MKNTLSRTGNFFRHVSKNFTIFSTSKKNNPLDGKVEVLMHADIDLDTDVDVYSDDDADIDADAHADIDSDVHADIDSDAHVNIDLDAHVDINADVDTDIDAVVDQFSPVLQIFIASCPWAICLCLNS